MARSGFNSKLVTTSVDSREVLRAMGKLPKEVQNSIRDTNLQNAGLLAREIRNNIDGSAPPQAQLVEPTIQPARDRVIHVKAGGNKRVGRPYKSSKGNGRKYRAPAGALVYGAEYGSSGKSQDRSGRNMGPRFVKRHNPQGNFIGPAVERFSPKLLRIWTKTIQTAIREKGFK